DRFQSNVSNIYALYDVITTHNCHVDLYAHVSLGWFAHRGDSVIAYQLARDASIHFKVYLRSNIVKCFDYTVASVGVTPNELSNFDYQIVEANQGAHAGYYPGNTKLHLRVYFEKSSRRIIRAAAVGKKGVDKRIDVLSMAMMNKLTIDE